MMNLTLVYTAAGAWNEAKELGRSVLRWCEKYQPPGAFRRLISMRNLAQAFMLCGKRDEAQDLLTKAMMSSKNTRGQEDVITLDIKQQLAWVNMEKGLPEIGEEMARRALEVQIRKLGRESAITIEGMAIHARGLALLGKWDAANALYTDFMNLAADTGYGRRVESIVHRLYWGDAYLRQGLLYRAEDLIIRSLEASRELCGKTHPTTAKGMEYLARLKWLQHRGSEAIIEMEHCLEMRSLILRPGHPDTQATSLMLQDMKFRHVSL
jgi:tetratricopeptide (TPR) repeat protein